MNSNSPPSDEQLIARVVNGGAEARAALGELVTRHHAQLVGFLYRMLQGDRALAEDLTQETFVRLLTRGGYQGGRPLKPWLYGIAVNLARDHFKSSTARHTRQTASLTSPDCVVSTADHEPGPEERALARESGREIAAAIGELATEYREVIILRFYSELSLKEIAVALDVPLGTVKSRLSVGCRRLRDLLEAFHHEAFGREQRGDGDI